MISSTVRATRASAVRERLLHRLEIAAWLLGGVLVAAFGGVRWWAESARAEGLEALRQAAASSEVGLPLSGAVEAPLPSISMNAGGEPQLDQSLWSSKRVRAFAATVASPGSPEGALRIPALELEVPVYSGTSELNLNRGAGHIEGTATLGSRGNAGVAGHRDGFFRKLKDLTIDAEIYLDVGDRSLRYRVVDIAIVSPTDVHVLAPTEVASITLVTCYPFYFLGSAPQRYIVRAEVVDL